MSFLYLILVIRPRHQRTPASSSSATIGCNGCRPNIDRSRPEGETQPLETRRQHVGRLEDDAGVPKASVDETHQQHGQRLRTRAGRWRQRPGQNADAVGERDEHQPSLPLRGNVPVRGQLPVHGTKRRDAVQRPGNGLSDIRVHQSDRRPEWLFEGTLGDVLDRLQHPQPPGIIAGNIPRLASHVLSSQVHVLVLVHGAHLGEWFERDLRERHTTAVLRAQRCRRLGPVGHDAAFDRRERNSETSGPRRRHTARNRPTAYRKRRRYRRKRLNFAEWKIGRNRERNILHFFFFLKSFQKNVARVSGTDYRKRNEICLCMQP